MPDSSGVHVIAGRPCTEKVGGRPWADALAALRKYFPQALVRITESPTAAVDLARQSVKEGATLVVAAGGDGTISQVVNGLLLSDASAGCKLGILPLGRGNDYYRTLLTVAGLKHDFNLEAATRRLLDGGTQGVDVGTVSYRSKTGSTDSLRFINLVTFGFSAAVTQSVTRTRWAGPAAYILGLATNLLSYHNCQGSLVIDGQPATASIFNLNVALGRYYGTAMFAAPKASLTDGLFDIVLMDGLNTVDVIRYMPNNYNGHFDEVPKVKQWQGRHIEVEGPAPILVQVDGEFVGTTPVTIDIAPACVQIVF